MSKHIFDYPGFAPDLREAELEHLRDYERVVFSSIGKGFRVYGVYFPIDIYNLFHSQYIYVSGSGKRNYVLTGVFGKEVSYRLKLLLDIMYMFYGPDTDGNTQMESSYIDLMIKTDWEGPRFTLPDHSIKIDFCYRNKHLTMLVMQRLHELDGISFN